MQLQLLIIFKAQRSDGLTVAVLVRIAISDFVSLDGQMLKRSFKTSLAPNPNPRDATEHTAASHRGAAQALGTPPRRSGDTMASTAATPMMDPDDEGATTTRNHFTLLHDKNMLAPASASSWCPTMDLLALATTDGQLSLARLDWNKQARTSKNPEQPVKTLHP
jgi:hypothetical protein